jgi:hypothetical protein
VTAQASPPGSEPGRPGPLDPRRGRRELLTACGGLFLASALGFLSAARPWVWLPGADGPVPIAGDELVGIVSAAGVVALAGVAGVVAASGRGRAAVGLLLAIVGAATAAGGLDVALRPERSVARWLAASGTGGPVPEGLTTTVWPWVGLVAGVLLVVAGAATYLRSEEWPVLGRRYDRGGSAPPDGPAGGPRAAWDALDRGEDPTAR